MARVFKRSALVIVVLVIAGLGFVWWYDRTGQRPDLDGWDSERLEFSRVNRLLADNAITNGRSSSARVHRVVTFTG